MIGRRLGGHEVDLSQVPDRVPARVLRGRRRCPAANVRRWRHASRGRCRMSRYGWTGRIRHGLYRCKCGHWNYYRTATERIDKRCNAQGCDYRARVVLDRTPRRGGRLRTVEVREYPPHRPPTTIKSEQRARNRHARQRREQGERMDLRIDRGVFHTASEIQAAQDAADVDRHGGDVPVGA